MIMDTPFCLLVTQACPFFPKILVYKIRRDCDIFEIACSACFCPPKMHGFDARSIPSCQLPGSAGMLQWIMLNAAFTKT